MGTELADLIAGERRALRATLEAVGPDAPTLILGWAAHDLALHVAAPDRFVGLPALAARLVASRFNLRLTEPYLRSATLLQLVNGRRRPWDWALAQLDQAPPGPLTRESVAPITLWEHFVHHEDVLRANSTPRPSSPPRLTRPLEWLLRYQRRRLAFARFQFSTPDGEWSIGSGEPVTVRGEVPEVLLWLSGRQSCAKVTCEGDARLLGITAARLRL